VTKAQGEKIEVEGKEWTCPNCKKNARNEHKAVKETAVKSMTPEVAPSPVVSTHVPALVVDTNAETAVGVSESTSVPTKVLRKSNNGNKQMPKSQLPCNRKGCTNFRLLGAYCSGKCITKMVDDYRMTFSVR
jgi:hypothetical protein